jgi:hypothetical protein
MTDKPSARALRRAREWRRWLRKDAELFAAYATQPTPARRARWREHAAQQGKLPGDEALKWIRQH